jgi:hypothetical protein
MAPRFLTILTGHDLPKIRHPREPEPSTIDEKKIADFTRVVEQAGILEREPATRQNERGRQLRRGLSPLGSPASVATLAFEHMKRSPL